MWRRSIVVVWVLVFVLVGLAVPAAAKVGVGVEIERSTHVEVGAPFTLRLVPLDCDGCPTTADITNLTMRVVTDEGSIVWEGGVSSQLTLDGIVLGEDQVKVDSATWLNVTVPTESILRLLPEEEAASSDLPEFLSIGRIAVLGTPTENSTTTLIVVVGVGFVVAVAVLLMSRFPRLRSPSDREPIANR